VNYADDFVILCQGSAEEARIRMHKIKGRVEAKGE
jgi:hypothetical protein